MRNQVLGGVTAVAIMTALSGPAAAADFPVRATGVPSSPIVLPYTWDGYYFGLHGGYTWANARFTDLDGSGGPPGSTFSKSASNGFGGAQLGYNFQLAALVFGLEADLGYMRVQLNVTDPADPTLDNNGTVSTGWYATATGRVGLAFERLLIYGKGGAAFLDGEMGVDDTTPLPGPSLFNAVGTQTLVGWTAGGGLEYGFYGGWSAKIEYLRMDFGTLSTSGFDSNSSTRVNFESRLVVDSIKVGLNFRFGYF